MRKDESKVVVTIIITFLIILSFQIFSLSKLEYPLPGDGWDHWENARAIQQDKALLSHNILFENAPQMYPQGYYVLFVSFSNLTGINIQETFIILPVILYLFYFSIVYLLAKLVTKSNIIAALSGLSIFFYWTYNLRYHYTVSFFSYAMPETLNIFLSLLIFVFIVKKEKGWFFVAAILTFLTSFIHRATSIALFILIGIIMIFNLKDKKAIFRDLCLLILLITGWSIQFVPNFIHYGLPSSSIIPQIVPQQNENNDAGFISSVNIKIKQEYNFFAMERYFYYGDGFQFNYIWVILIIIGFVILIKQKMISYKLLPYFLLPIIHVVNKLTINTPTLENPAYFFFTPVAYFLFSGIAFYYLISKFSRRVNVLFLILILIIFLPYAFITVNNIPIKPADVTIFALKSNEHIGISDESISFFNQTPKDSIIIACPTTSRVLKIITQRQVLHTAYARYGMYVFDLYNISERHEDVRKIYESCDFNETIDLMNKYGSDVYIYVGTYDQATYRICLEKLDNYFVKEDFGKDRIYYVNDLNE